MTLLRVILPVLLVLPFIRAALQPYNVTLTSDSSTLNYYPSRTGASPETWNVTYTSSDWSTYTPNASLGIGESPHFTTHIGAWVSVGWVGTAVYVWGLAGVGVYTFSVDGQTVYDVNATTGMLGMVSGLDDGWHELVVTVTGEQGVTLQGMTVTTGVGETGYVNRFLSTC